MMKEAKIILPIANNSGESIDVLHNRLKKALCRLFGGYTATASNGGWMSPDGTLYEEPGVVYTVAMDSAGNGRLRVIAQALALLASQECIYVQYTSGQVVFIDSAGIQSAYAWYILNHYKG